jgi:hypothetical protein
MKAIGGQEKTKFRGRDRVGWAFTFTAATYDTTARSRSIAYHNGDEAVLKAKPDTSSTAR